LCHDVLSDTKFYEFLLKADRDLCEQVREGGCPRCGGRLDSARYPRKPRGAMLAAGWDSRESLCCDACRKRVTPASVRYLGRRVYIGAIVVLACILRDGSTTWRETRLRAMAGVDRRTLARWRTWWVEEFPRTDLWRAQRGRLMPVVAEPELPSSLLGRFAGGLREQLDSMLRFLSPLTTTSWAAT
jgi:hypothetical protein